MPEMVSRFDKLTQIVRRGGALEEHSSVAPDNPIWVEFARGMAPMMQMSALAIADVVEAKAGKPMKVLDIAAGHGMFGLAIARMNPNAQIVALDWPNVLAVAEENAKKFGVADRWSKKAGSAFEAEYGEGYDYILLTNILHHFDHAGNVTLMKRVYAAATHPVLSISTSATVLLCARSENE